MQDRVRRAAVAGRFYPAEVEELTEDVDAYLEQGEGEALEPVAVIGPHAGYVYSGPIAGSAWRDVADLKGRVKRVLLLGPSHYVAFEGIAAPPQESFQTPLGELAVDVEAIDALEAEGLVGRSAEPHRQEHGLEVHLPFIQRTLGPVEVIPLVIGRTSTTHVARVIEALWQDEATLVAVSSDLSHYLDYEACRKVDAETCASIEALEEEPIGPQEACGFLAVRGLLRVAKARELEVHTQDVRNSGDTAGGRDRVVGYGAWVFTQG